jgi:hypothetical protein
MAASPGSKAEMQWGLLGWKRRLRKQDLKEATLRLPNLKAPALFYTQMIMGLFLTHLLNNFIVMKASYSVLCADDILILFYIL